MVELRSGQWFQTLLLTAFTVSDIVGRFLTGFRFGLHPGNIGISIILRALVFPLIVLCIMDPAMSDHFAFVVVAMFGFLNGYFVSMSLIVVNEIPQMTDSQRKTCGR